MGLRNNGMSFPQPEGVILCTSATHPASPYAGMRIYETDTGADKIYGGPTVGFTMPWAAPWGILFSGSPTVSSVINSSAVTTIPNSTNPSPLVMPNNRLLRIAFVVQINNQTQAADRVNMIIQEATAGNIGQTVRVLGEINATITVQGFAMFTSAGGISRTFNLGGSLSSGGGQFTVITAVTNYITIEDVGPSPGVGPS